MILYRFFFFVGFMIDHPVSPGGDGPRPGGGFDPGPGQEARVKNHQSVPYFSQVPKDPHPQTRSIRSDDLLSSSPPEIPWSSALGRVTLQRPHWGVTITRDPDWAPPGHPQYYLLLTTT